MDEDGRVSEAGCLACEATAGRVTVPGGVIYEDRYWRVEHSVSPVVLCGFLIVKPQRHCEHIADLTSDEAQRLGPILQNTARALTEILHPARVYIASFGESVKHIHFYMIPRMPDMPAEGPALLQTMFEDRPWACRDEEAAEVAGRIREKLQQLGDAMQ